MGVGRDESSSSSLLIRIGGGRDSIGLIRESIMSATLQNLMKSTKSLAEVASKTVGSKASHQYAKLMEANAKYVLEDKSKLADMPAYTAQASKEWHMTKAKLSGWRELSASEAATGLLFAGEVFAWFCVGEYVGRGFSLTGYNY